MSWFSWLRRLLKRRGKEINPDEVLLDAHNLPRFDEGLFEGRIEQALPKRAVFFFGMAMLLLVLLYASQAFRLQVALGETYAEISENNHLHHSLLFADRGVIYDRKGTPLAWNEVFPGEPFSKRVYFEDAGLAHLVGYVGYPLKDNNNKYYEEGYTARSGVELVYDGQVDGMNGLQIIETNALGEVESESTTREPTSGNHLALSIDARLNETLYREIEARVEESGFTGGAGVIMDVETGELLALVNYPEFNANTLFGTSSEPLQNYLADSRKPFLNRVVSGLYAPGSIVKPFIALAALEEGVISPEKEILSTGQLVLPNPYFPDQPSVFRDWKAHGYVDMRQALAVSSDVYFYQVGGGFENQRGLGIERIEKYMRMFGFGSGTGIILPAEAEGVIPSPAWKEANFEGEPWRVGNTYHTAIGQYGFQVTPLQAVRAIAALANGGGLLTPSVIKGGESTRTEYLAFDPDHIGVVHEGMRRAVTEGTASGLSMPQVAVAAKTGTAELGAKKDFVNSWVIGFFPYENPKYAFAVLMERGPAKNLIGALSVMRRTMDWMVVNTPEYLSNSQLTTSN